MGNNAESDLNEVPPEIKDDIVEAEEVAESANTTEGSTAAQKVEPSAETANVPEDDYFADDENFGKATDAILFEDEEVVIAQQEEVVVKWDIDRLYDENNKVRSKRSLRNNPPVLKISNSNDELVEFVLTKDLSGVLARHLENVHRGYYGIKPRSELTMKEKLNDFGSVVKRNRGKVILIGGLVVALLVAAFVL